MEKNSTTGIGLESSAIIIIKLRIMDYGDRAEGVSDWKKSCK